MEKKDLVIGRKYLHKENREVYYLGESKIGDSIVQPTNGIDGIVSLKACHPELKDIIGSDRFWGYYNMHLELSEIEQKYLTVNELIDGEIYEYDENIIVKYPSGANIDPKNNTFEEGYDWMWNLKIREANQEQKDWLNKCIKADKFVPKDYVKNTFEAGRWYKYSANYIKESTYAKYSSNQSLADRFYYDEIITEKNGYKKGHNWSVLTCIPILLTDLSEIQEFLPDRHPDKVTKEFVLPEKWHCKVTNDNLKFFKSLKQYSHLNLGDWSSIIDGNTGRDTCNLDKNYTEITFEQFKQYVLKQEEKPIEKWSVGSYIVFTETCDEYDNAVIGNIDKIETNRGSYINLEKFKSLSLVDPEIEVKWFATLEEAQEFSDTLKNKKEEGWTPQVGDLVEVTIGFSNNIAQPGYVGNITRIDKASEIKYEVDNSWCMDVKKALPHEIPSQVMKIKESELNVDLGMIQFNNPAINSFEIYNKYFLGADPFEVNSYTPIGIFYNKECYKSNELDLSLRDEKEVNVNEIKTSNNNISKLNLSLNN